MVALADIAPPSDTGVSVTLHGQSVDVTGITAAGAVVLLRRYPELQQMFTGKEVTFSVDRLFEIVPESIASVIAAGLGSPGDKKAEATAAKLPLEAQVEALNKIMEVTMPKGIIPFVEGLTKLLGAVGSTAGSITARATNSRSPSKS